jgi:hypothetical protein
LPSADIYLTTTLPNDAGHFRLEVAPSSGNGLREVFRIATEKLTAVPSPKSATRSGKLMTASIARWFSFWAWRDRRSRVE